jgi:hypothetical protein
MTDDDCRGIRAEAAALREEVALLRGVVAALRGVKGVAPARRSLRPLLAAAAAGLLVGAALALALRCHLGAP